MSSDIDIEEHNVLDDPKIKTIFPDISSIKSEIVDIEEDEMPEYTEENFLNHSTNEMEQDDLLDDGIDNIHLIDPASFHHVSQNKIILGSKPVLQEKHPFVSQNKIILGSKPIIKEKDPFSVHVMLKDWKYILSKHPYFCQDCTILFPTQNTMDAHKMSAHSLLIAVNEFDEVIVDNTPRVNKAKKSTTKSVAIVKSSSGFRLNKAVKSTAKTPVKIEFEEDINSAHESEMVVREPTVDVKKCPICKCYYLTDKYIHFHFLKNHGTTQLTPINEPFNGTCSFCGYKTMAFKTYNNHIQFNHSAIYKKLCEPQNYVCSEHDLTFTSANSLHIHQVATHQTSVSEDKIDSQNSTIHLTVPKEILFVCDKCPLHFLASSVAFYHSTHCALGTAKSPRDWTCTQCNRSFRLLDKNKHLLQHKLFNKFNVLTVSKELVRRVICKCPNCDVIFDERTFWKSHAWGCVKTKTVQCNVCGLNVDQLFVERHEKMHAANLDVLVVDFFIGNSEGTKPLDIILYYCYDCKTYSHTKILFHLSGKCREVKSMRRVICKLCGLSFTLKSYKTHMTKEHSYMNFQLSDVHFHDVKSDEEISPPLPEWKKCSECHINFFGQQALRGHVCYEEKYKHCAKCEEGFSDLAYKLHLPFHELEEPPIQKISKPEDVEIPDILKKYELMQSLWNIIYLCEVCDIVFDNYDKVVEHCQDHFCNMESFDVQIEHCYTCNLKFVGASYEKHIDFHLSSINKNSFTILKFNYENLLNNEWMDMFKVISEEQRGHILARSVYDIDRSIRLELEKDGLSSITLFKCSICNTIIDRSNILEHAKNKDACAQITNKYNCSFCDLMFPNKNAQLVHENDHRYTLKGKTVRLITFNKPSDFATNLVMSNIPRKDSLKFNWCQECGLLIKKDAYNTHILKHRSKKVGYVIKNGIKPLKKLYDIYKCISCGAGIFSTLQVKKHTCLPDIHYTKCKYCNLKYRKCFIKKHHMFHRLKPRCNQNTINVIPFGPNSQRPINTDSSVSKRQIKSDLAVSQRQIKSDLAVSQRQIKSDLAVSQRQIKSDPAVSQRQIKSDSSVPLGHKGIRLSLTVFECQKCKACVLKHWKQKLHNCVPSSSKLTCCPICQVCFRKVKFKLHENFHKRNPNITRDCIKIVKYNFPKPMKRKLEPVTAPTKKIKVDPLVEQRNLSTNSKIPLQQSYYRRRISEFYKCSCNLLFMNRESLVAHFNICENDRIAVKCTDCGLQFHKRDIGHHILARSCLDKKFYLIATIKINNKHTRDANYWISVCGKCNLFGLTGLRIHISKGHMMGSIRICPTCNVPFPRKRLKNHVDKHHGQMNMTVSKLNQVIYSTVSISELMKLNSKIGRTNERVAHAPRSFPSHNASKNCEEAKLRALFKCTDCNLHFTCTKTLRYHYEKNLHNEKRFACKYCGLDFTKIIIRRHEDEEHTINDFKIVTYAGSNSEQGSFKKSCDTSSNYSFEGTPSKIIPSPLKIPINNRTSVNTDISMVDVTKLTPEERRIVKKVSITPIHILKYIYQCDICKINCVHEDSITKHMVNNRHTSKLTACDQCGLLFTTISLSRHKYMHHSILKLKLEDFKLRVYLSDTRFIDVPTPNKIKTKSIASTEHNVSAQSITPTKRIVAEKSISSTDHAIGVKSISSTEHKIAPKSSSPKIVAEPLRHKPDAPKLYKCSLCDVHFTSYDMCWEHATNHTPLDSTEYIACKICDLQFICECLGVHMRGHREKTFNIDDLVVTECQPRMNAPPIINTYLAAEKLKSKLISTTTDCGNEY